jgi:hypothetical protein
MKVACEHCGRQYNAPDHLLGRRIKCKHCGLAFVIAPLDEEPIETASFESHEQPQSEQSSAEVFQPSRYSGTARRPGKSGVPSAVWISGGIAGFLLLLILLIVHPWSGVGSTVGVGSGPSTPESAALNARIPHDPSPPPSPGNVGLASQPRPTPSLPAGDAQTAGGNAVSSSPKWELSQAMVLPGNLQVVLPAGAHVEEVVPGIGLYEVTVHEFDGTELKFDVKNVIQPQQQYEQEMSASNNADGSSRVEWIELNGLHMAKIILKDKVTDQQFTVGFKAYQNGRTFGVTNAGSFFDPDVPGLLEAVVRTVGMPQ